MKEIQLNLLNTPDQPIVILEGQALTPKDSLILTMKGNIESVKNFLSKRYTDGKSGSGHQFIDPATATVYADDEDMSITLKSNPNNPYGTTIIGKLEFTPELKSFNINNGKTWTRNELVKFLRQNIRFFDNREKGVNLFAAYSDMNIQTEGEIKQSSDNRGNKSNLLEKRVKTEGIPTEFILNMPIFKGQPKKTFRVEIDIETTDSMVKFEFVSPELTERIEEDKKEIFVSELQCCTDFPIIYK